MNKFYLINTKCQNTNTVHHMEKTSNGYAFACHISERKKERKSDSKGDGGTMGMRSENKKMHLWIEHQTPLWFMCRQYAKFHLFILGVNMKTKVFKIFTMFLVPSFYASTNTHTIYIIHIYIYVYSTLRSKWTEYDS